MISEAVASGKEVIVFELERKKRTSKFDKMLHHLKEKGYIKVAKADELSDAIAKSLSASSMKSLPEDHFNVYKYMWRLL